MIQSDANEFGPAYARCFAETPAPPDLTELDQLLRRSIGAIAAGLRNTG